MMVTDLEQWINGGVRNNFTREIMTKIELKGQAKRMTCTLHVISSYVHLEANDHLLTRDVHSCVMS